jgi:hypothetical protein
MSIIKLLFQKYFNDALAIGLWFTSSPWDPSTCFISKIKLLIHKYFNDACALLLYFTSSPWDPSSIPRVHSCFTLIKMNGECFNSAWFFYCAWQVHHVNFLVFHLVVHVSHWLLMKMEGVSIMHVPYLIVFHKLNMKSFKCLTSSPWNHSSVLLRRACFILVKMNGFCFTNAWALWLGFTSWTWNPSTVSLLRACFTLLTNGWTVFQ